MLKTVESILDELTHGNRQSFGITLKMRSEENFRHNFISKDFLHSLRLLPYLVCILDDSASIPKPNVP